MIEKITLWWMWLTTWLGSFDPTLISAAMKDRYL